MKRRKFMSEAIGVVTRRKDQSRPLERELVAALAESRADLAAGRFLRESVENHIERLKKLAS
jgi:hypothetical protein